jgi:hypothetical protein
VDESQVERTVAACEQALAGSGKPDLRALGFWPAVAAVKRRGDLVERYASRIAAIDREAFRRSVPLVFPVTLGVIVLDVALFGGLLLLAIALGVGHPWRELLVLAAAGAIDVAVHGLAHLAVGTFAGIGFTDWFISLPKPPGFKIDYASYLRTPPRQRAWMHAAGAIASKLTPFLVIPYAIAIDTDTWAVLALLAFGVIQIVTDLLYSVRASDWKKFRREMELAGR